ncbi:hypothetical protein O3M35_001180 [Rhynocoris fuscipes]|uniref:Uncharacterized protein n=1 Tax=Rhynocoris fuscipes TaxID=488301 RepID=A0AAW1DPH1_9HEMI
MMSSDWRRVAVITVALLILVLLLHLTLYESALALRSSVPPPTAADHLTRRLSSQPPPIKIHFPRTSRRLPQVFYIFLCLQSKKKN